MSFSGPTRLLGPSLLALACAGCGTFGSRAELESCRKRTQALQAEAVQLKDQAVALRSQNRDLARRGVDDDKRLRSLEESNARLTASVTAYQRERDSLAAGLDQIKAQVQAAADSPARTAARDDP